jgi:hypothetical protein
VENFEDACAKVCKKKNVDKIVFDFHAGTGMTLIGSKTSKKTDILTEKNVKDFFDKAKVDWRDMPKVEYEGCSTASGKGEKFIQKTADTIKGSARGYIGTGINPEDSYTGQRGSKHKGQSVTKYSE